MEVNYPLRTAVFKGNKKTEKSGLKTIDILINNANYVHIIRCVIVPNYISIHYIIYYSCDNPFASSIALGIEAPMFPLGLCVDVQLINSNNS